MSASFGSTNSSSASSNREEVEPIDAPMTATAVAAHVADAAITSSSIANTASVTVTTATATATTMSTEDLLELVKAIKFANPDYSQRDCYTEIVTVIPTKFPSYASLLNTTTINLNDVKKVWKKANSNTNNNNAAAKKQNEKNNDDLADRLRAMNTNPEVYTIGVGNNNTNKGDDNATANNTANIHSSSSSSSSSSIAKAYVTQYLQEQMIISQAQTRIMLEDYVHVFLDVPGDRSGTRPHQALINFQQKQTQSQKSQASFGGHGKKKKKGKKNKKSGAGVLAVGVASASAAPFEDAIIVKIQMAAPIEQTRLDQQRSQQSQQQQHPMLLYDQTRKYKTFIHPNCTLTRQQHQQQQSNDNNTNNNSDNDDDGYTRIARWIDQVGVDGALGSTGGTKAYFYGRVTTPAGTRTTNGSRILSIYVKKLAPTSEQQF